jgi:hypothetical protein
MKTIVVGALLSIMAITFFTSCEKNDYQDPRYRSSQHK